MRKLIRNLSILFMILAILLPLIGCVPAPGAVGDQIVDDGTATSNRVVYFSDGASGKVGSLAAGTAGQVLTSNGASAPSWASANVRTVSGALTAGNVNSIGFSWNNPESSNIYITKIVITVTTVSTAAATLQVGIADSATGTNLGSEFHTAITLNATGIYDSYLAGDTGAQVKWISCLTGTTTDAWVNGKILVQNATGLVGKYYIFYTVS